MIHNLGAWQKEVGRYAPKGEARLYHCVFYSVCYSHYKDTWYLQTTCILHCCFWQWILSEPIPNIHVRTGRQMHYELHWRRGTSAISLHWRGNLSSSLKLTLVKFFSFTQKSFTHARQKLFYSLFLDNFCGPRIFLIIKRINSQTPWGCSLGICDHSFLLSRKLSVSAPRGDNSKERKQLEESLSTIKPEYRSSVKRKRRKLQPGS